MKASMAFFPHDVPSCFFCFFPNLLYFPSSKTRIEMQKALEQDSTVYDYDAVYDEIQNQRQEKTQKTLHGTDKRVIFILKLCSMFFLPKLHVGYIHVCDILC